VRVECLLKPAQEPINLRSKLLIHCRRLAMWLKTARPGHSVVKAMVSFFELIGGRFVLFISQAYLQVRPYNWVGAILS